MSCLLGTPHFSVCVADWLSIPTPPTCRLHIFIGHAMEDLEGATPSTTAAFALTSSLLPSASIAGGDDALPVGLTLTPLAPLPEDLVLRRDVLRCERCAGYIGPHCDVFHGSWRCGLCATENRTLNLSTSPTQQPAELTSSVVEYVLRPPPRVAPRKKKEECAPGVVVFLVDDTAGADALADVLAAVRASLPLLPPDALVGLIAFGRVISIYTLDETSESASSGGADALVLPADEPPVQWELDRLAEIAPSVLAPRGEGDSLLVRALEALQPPPPLRAAIDGHKSSRRAPGDEGRSPRGMLAAIDLALDVIALSTEARGVPPPPSGLLIIAGLSGAPTLGVGAIPIPPRHGGHPPRTAERDAAVDALRDAGGRLARAGLAPILACSGTGSFDLEALRALALPSGGSIALMRRPGPEAAATLGAHFAELLGAVGRRGAAGALTVRCSHDMSVSQVVGCAASFNPAVDAADGDADGDGVCFLGAMHPATTLSLILDVSAVSDEYTRSARSPAGVVQAALRYTRADGERRLRIYVARAPFASTTDEWLRALDLDATALLAARTAALAASRVEKDDRDANALAQRADAIAQNWVRCYAVPRLGVRKGWLWDATTTVGYDASAVPNLAALLRRLHRLRSSPAACANDDVDVDAAHAARFLLLTAPAPIAARIAMPPPPRTTAPPTGPIGALRPTGAMSPRVAHTPAVNLESDADGEDADADPATAALAALAKLTLAERRGRGVPSDEFSSSLSAWCDALGGVVLDGVADSL